MKLKDPTSIEAPQASFHHELSFEHPDDLPVWKNELHHQDEPWIRSLERMLQWRKRKRERKRGGSTKLKEEKGREVEL